jgi:hypothetical protein
MKTSMCAMDGNSLPLECGGLTPLFFRHFQKKAASSLRREATPWQASRRTPKYGQFVLALLLLSISGCATSNIDKPVASSAAQPLPWFLPDNVNMNHRALVTIHGRQFAWNGSLTGNTNDGLRLVITDTIGLVADLKLDRNGAVTVGRLSPYFKEEWVRSYIARDLAAVFFPVTPNPGGKETVRYIFNNDGTKLEKCEIRRGTRRVCGIVCSQHVQAQGRTKLLPTQFKISGEGYEVNLRILDTISPDKKAQP